MVFVVVLSLLQRVKVLQIVVRLRGASTNDYEVRQTQR